MTLLFIDLEEALTSILKPRGTRVFAHALTRLAAGAAAMLLTASAWAADPQVSLKTSMGSYSI